MTFGKFCRKQIKMTEIRKFGHFFAHLMPTLFLIGGYNVQKIKTNLQQTFQFYEIHSVLVRPVDFQSPEFWKYLQRVVFSTVDVVLLNLDEFICNHHVYVTRDTRYLIRRFFTQYCANRVCFYTSTQIPKQKKTLQNKLEILAKNQNFEILNIQGEINATSPLNKLLLKWHIQAYQKYKLRRTTLKERKQNIFRTSDSRYLVRPGQIKVRRDLFKKC